MSSPGSTTWWRSSASSGKPTRAWCHLSRTELNQPPLRRRPAHAPAPSLSSRVASPLPIPNVDNNARLTGESFSCKAQAGQVRCQFPARVDDPLLEEAEVGASGLLVHRTSLWTAGTGGALSALSWQPTLCFPRDAQHKRLAGMVAHQPSMPHRPSSLQLPELRSGGSESSCAVAVFTLPSFPFFPFFLFTPHIFPGCWLSGWLAGWLAVEWPSGTTLRLPGDLPALVRPSELAC